MDAEAAFSRNIGHWEAIRALTSEFGLESSVSWSQAPFTASISRSGISNSGFAPIPFCRGGGTSFAARDSDLGGGSGGGPESSSDESEDETRSRNRSPDSLSTMVESLLEVRCPAARAPSAMAKQENLSCSGVWKSRRTVRISKDKAGRKYLKQHVVLFFFFLHYLDALFIFDWSNIFI